MRARKSRLDNKVESAIPEGLSEVEGRTLPFRAQATKGVVAVPPTMGTKEGRTRKA